MQGTTIRPVQFKELSLQTLNRGLNKQDASANPMQDAFAAVNAYQTEKSERGELWRTAGHFLSRASAGKETEFIAFCDAFLSADESLQRFQIGQFVVENQGLTLLIYEITDRYKCITIEQSLAGEKKDLKASIATAAGAPKASDQLKVFNQRINLS